MPSGLCYRGRREASTSYTYEEIYGVGASFSTITALLPFLRGKFT
jgi:hypothetical protein